ncbi:hypothetical protein FNV43_RR20250 [Rhamnella rubrinervis]|uniref:Uncharacterized protein n=1 Tax=Rhamnella rubrinervis TaxID=2594499 RepID=A0A8K0E636_9ROSA|nr:hypothetical protein FNV43_RR20250 [Rhamnella rubrinervis]
MKQSPAFPTVNNALVSLTFPVYIRTSQGSNGYDQELVTFSTGQIRGSVASSSGQVSSSGNCSTSAESSSIAIDAPLMDSGTERTSAGDPSQGIGAECTMNESIWECHLLKMGRKNSWKFPRMSARAAEEKNNELTKQVEELRAQQDGMEESIFQRLRADVEAHFQQAGLNVETPSWMHGATFNGGSSFGLVLTNAYFEIRFSVTQRKAFSGLEDQIERVVNKLMEIAESSDDSSGTKEDADGTSNLANELKNFIDNIENHMEKFIIQVDKQHGSDRTALSGCFRNEMRTKSEVLRKVNEITNILSALCIRVRNRSFKQPKSDWPSP